MSRTHRQMAATEYGTKGGKLADYIFGIDKTLVVKYTNEREYAIIQFSTNELLHGFLTGKYGRCSATRDLNAVVTTVSSLFEVRTILSELYPECTIDDYKFVDGR